MSPFRTYSVVLEDIVWCDPVESSNIVWMCEVRAVGPESAAQLAVHMLAESSGHEVESCQPSVVEIVD